MGVVTRLKVARRQDAATGDDYVAARMHEAYRRHRRGVWARRFFIAALYLATEWPMCPVEEWLRALDDLAVTVESLPDRSGEFLRVP